MRYCDGERTRDWTNADGRDLQRPGQHRRKLLSQGLRVIARALLCSARLGELGDHPRKGKALERSRVRGRRHRDEHEPLDQDTLAACGGACARNVFRLSVKAARALHIIRAHNFNVTFHEAHNSTSKADPCGVAFRARSWVQIASSSKAWLAGQED